MNLDELETYCPSGPKQWRVWLQKNHHKKQSVWLVQYKKGTGKPSLSWSEAVEEALCFGWIDSTRRTIDNERYMQYFCRRKPGSTWSKINKEKVKKLIAEGRMADAGLARIEAAKANGAWSRLDGVEELTLPADLSKAFRGFPAAKKYFKALRRTDKRMLLQWIELAKRKETREARIADVVACACEHKKPRPFR